MTLAKVSTLTKSSSFGCLAEPERRQHSLRILVSVFPNGYFSNIFRTVSFDTAPRQRKVPFGKLSEGRRFLAFCMLAMACADSGVGCQRGKEEYVTVRQMAKHVRRFFASRPSLDPETKENTIISGKVSGLFNRKKLKRFHARQWLNTGRWGPCLRNLGMGRNLSFIPPPSRAPARCSRDEPDGNRMDFLHGGLSMPGERRPGPACGGMSGNSNISINN